MDKDKKYQFNSFQQARTAKQRLMDAKNLPPIKPLFSSVWQENELHFLFADTGIGKSVFATALCDAISKGERFLSLENSNIPLKVQFYDFELSDRQFRKRYTDANGNDYEFSDNLIIDNLEFDKLMEIDTKAKFSEILFEKIKYDIEMNQVKVLVIDNITYLSMQSAEDTQIALDTMRKLNELKREYGLSILVLAHTPKRTHYSPISINDMGGSKMLANFSDSVSTIGQSSKDSNTRYFKQVKPSRSGEMIYDSNNVIVCEMVKKGSMLTFEKIEYGNEFDHLSLSTETTQIPDKVYQVVELLKQNKSYDDIAGALNMSKGTITKWKENPKYSQLFVSVSTVSDSGTSGNMETGNESNSQVNEETTNN